MLFRSQKTGGGDSDEFYELVIKKITEETPWREGSKKALLFIGDCNPHPLGYKYGLVCPNNQIDWREEANKATKIGLEIDTLSCGGSGIEFYKSLSFITNGIHIPFTTQSKTSEAIYATTSVRGSTESKAMFMSMTAEATERGDTEMIGTYKALNKKL